MTAFTKTNLIKDGEYVVYQPESGPQQFVARFKYGSRTSIGPFMTCLRRNITVEDYFARREADESPLAIAESFGFVLSHIKKWLKQDGYPTTREGYEQWFADKYSTEARGEA